jgi:hypothetical protein
VGPILLCCIVMEISTGWGRFGGGGFDPSLAVRWTGTYTLYYLAIIAAIKFQEDKEVGTNHQQTSLATS